MIYSRWRPAKGGYDYFEGGGKDIPLANDLPVPQLPSGTDIGVASVEIGRAMPSGARRVGSGELAQGMMAPTLRSGGLLGLGELPTIQPAYLWFCAGAFASWFILKSKR